MYRGKPHPESLTGRDMLDCRFRSYLPFIYKKVELRLHSPGKRTLRFQEQSTHPYIADARYVFAVVALPVHPYIGASFHAAR